MYRIYHILHGFFSCLVILHMKKKLHLVANLMLSNFSFPPLISVTFSDRDILLVAAVFFLRKCFSVTSTLPLKVTLNIKSFHSSHRKAFPSALMLVLEAFILHIPLASFFCVVIWKGNIQPLERLHLFLAYTLRDRFGSFPHQRIRGSSGAACSCFSCFLAS